MESAKSKSEIVRKLALGSDKIKIISCGRTSDNFEKIRIIAVKENLKGCGGKFLSIDVTPFFTPNANYRQLELKGYPNPVVFLIDYIETTCGIRDRKTLIEIVQKTKYIK